jgi:predicted CoA-binding protein
MAVSVDEFMQKTINLKHWAVVGASPKPERYSNKIQKILMERGYTVYPVRPAMDEIEGLKCYASVSELPDDVEVVDMVVNPSVGIEAMKEIAAKGIKYVWLQPGAESDEIQQYADENGIEAVEGCILATLTIRKDHHV